MPTRVLVTGAGGAAAISFMRAVASPDVELYAADIDPHATGLYMVPPERRFLVPRGDDPGFVGALLTLCEDHGIDVLLPTVDTELLPVAESIPRFGALGTIPLVSGPRSLRSCLDKWTLMRTCWNHVPVPRTALYDEALDLARLDLPVIVKPRSGSGGRGVRLVRSLDDLAGVPRDGSHIVQDYLPGEEYSVDVFVDPRGEVRAAVPRARLKVDSGVAVCARTLHDDELEAISAAVARILDLRFTANIQWKRDAQGRPKLLEINPRFPGTMPLTVAAGVDMPNLSLLACQGLPLPAIPRHAEVALVRRWEEIAVDVGELEAMMALDSEGCAPAAVSAA